MMNRNIVSIAGLFFLMVAPVHADATQGSVPRDLAANPPPEGQSSVPELKEWKGGEDVQLARPLPTGCRATLVREWLRVRCDGRPGSGALLSGDRTGVAFYAHVQTREFAMAADGHFNEVIFPLRRGDRRLIQLTEASGSVYEGMLSQNPRVLISEQWLGGGKGPVITALAEAERPQRP